MKKALKWIALLVLVCVLPIASILLYWRLRPNTAVVDPAFDIETWVAVGDGTHNSNTDLAYWNDHFYLIHASSPWHLASEKCHLVLHRSKDAREWKQIATFSIPDQDIRDPKLAVIGDRLFMYVLKNKAVNPEPYTTAVTSSLDGEEWTPLKDIDPEGWLFWRPKTRDDKTWYVPAYWWEHGKSALLKSTDGENWEMVSTIYEGDRNDETDVTFMSDGRMLCTARLEVSDSIFGHKDACTLIAAADPPYTEWTNTKSRVTRLDGPNLFTYGGRAFAAARHNPQKPKPFFWLGSAIGKKRTALYEVTEEKLIYLTDLPSCGDTSYTGVVMLDGDLYISYYTNDITKDYPWIMGMLSASDIRIAKLPLAKLTDRSETATEGSP